MPLIPHQYVSVKPNTQPDMERWIDWAGTTIAANTWGKAGLVLPETLHLAAAWVHWEGFEHGDYGFLVLVNPAGDGSLSVQANSGQKNLDIGTTSIAAYYDTAHAAYAGSISTICVEIWNSGETALLERGTVASVSGSVITLDANLNTTHAVGCKVRCVIKTYHPMRGTDLLEGGIGFLGTGDHDFGSLMETEVSEPIGSGMCICMRVKTVSGGSTRKLTVSFFCRRPAP